jgi:hypothetical protein
METTTTAEASCDVCRHGGSLLDFAYVPYPLPGDPPGMRYESSLKCPRCGAGATLKESA